MSNIKIGSNTYSGVDTIKVKNADDESQYVEFKQNTGDGSGYGICVPGWESSASSYDEAIDYVPSGAISAGVSAGRVFHYIPAGATINLAIQAGCILGYINTDGKFTEASDGNKIYFHNDAHYYGSSSDVNDAQYDVFKYPASCAGTWNKSTNTITGTNEKKVLFSSYSYKTVDDADLEVYIADASETTMHRLWILSKTLSMGNQYVTPKSLKCYAFDSGGSYHYTATYPRTYPSASKYTIDYGIPVKNIYYGGPVTLENTEEGGNLWLRCYVNYTYYM